MIDKKQKKEAMIVENTFPLVSTAKDMSTDLQSAMGDDWYRLLLDIANDGLTVHLLTSGKRSGKFIEANKVICERLGYTKDELLKLSPLNVTPERYTDVLVGLKKKILQSKHLIFELAEKTKDGREIPVEINSHLFERDGQQYILSVSRDITRRKRADAQLTQARDNLEKRVDQRATELVKEVADHVRTLKSLQDSETTLRAILEAVPDGIAVFDLDGKFVEANSALITLHGYRDKKDFMQHHIMDFMAANTRTVAWESMKELLLKMGYVGAVELTMLTREDTEFLAEMSASLLKDVEGKPIGFVSITKDVTRRKLAEQALVESEEKLRVIFDTSPVGILVANTQGILTDINQNLVRLGGYASKNEVIGRSAFEFVAIGDLDKAMAVFSRVIAGENTGTHEYKLIAKDGRTLDVEIGYAAIKDVAGKFEGFIGSVVDITERKRAGKALKDSETRNRAIIAAIPDMMFVMDRRGTFLDFVSSETVTPLVSVDQFLGAKVNDILPSAVAKKMLVAIKEALDSEQTKLVEYEIRYPEGVRDYEARLAVYGTDTVLGITRDITDRKLAQQEIAKLNSAVQQSIDGIAIADLDKKITYVNDAFARMHGYLPDEMTGMLIKDLFNPEVMDIYRENRRRIDQDGASSVEGEHIRNDGTTFPIFESVTVMKSKDDKPIGVVIVLRDITEQKLAAQKMATLTSAVEQSIDGIAIFDWGRNITFVNDAFAGMHGYRPQEMIGIRLMDLLAREETRDYDEARQLVEEFGSRSIEVLHYRKDKTIFPVFSSVTIIKDANGEPVGVVTVVRDMTEQKRAEAKLKEYSENLEHMVEERTRELTEVHDKLMRSEKLAVIGQLASGIAHELRNPLAVINNSTYFIKMKMTVDDQKVARHLEILEREVFRSSGIIDGLLDFARSREPKINEARIDQIVDAVLDRIKWPQNVKLVRKDNGFPLIDVDVEQIGRVFSNIINNALQSMPNGGTITLNASIDDGFVAIKIADTGSGVSEKNLDKIFEPLFTTRSGVGGTGIGLAICKSIVDAHQGCIEVVSAEGKGTAFTIKLPFNQK